MIQTVLIIILSFFAFDLLFDFIISCSFAKINGFSKILLTFAARNAIMEPKQIKTL